MKYLPVLLLVFMLGSCAVKSDLSLQDGTYRMFSPVSIGGQMINDRWTISGDNFTITRNDSVIYTASGIYHDGHYDLFPSGNNPYYNESFASGKITVIDWGFYFYPSSGKTFTLQREN